MHGLWQSGKYVHILVVDQFYPQHARGPCSLAKGQTLEEAEGLQVSKAWSPQRYPVVRHDGEDSQEQNIGNPISISKDVLSQSCL